MRNTTKLKAVLRKYSVSLDLDDDDIFKMAVIDKTNNRMEQFEGDSYSMVLRKAYSYLLKEVKTINRMRKN